MQGQNLGAGDPNALFLKVWSGRVYLSFRSKTRLLPYVDSQVLTNAESATFDLFGQVSSTYHTPGADILVENPDSGQQTSVRVFLDDTLYTSKLFTDEDDVKAHFEFRPKWTMDFGRRLAQDLDTALGQCFLAAARGAEQIPGETGKAAVAAQANALTDPLVVADMIRQGAAAFDDLGVPDDTRFCMVRPDMYQKLAATPDLLNNFTSTGNGDLARAHIARIGDVQIIKVPSKTLPSADNTGVSLGSGVRNDIFGTGFDADWSKTAGIMFSPEAVGLVTGVGLTTEVSREHRNMSDLVSTKTMFGCKPINHAAAVELVSL